LVCPFLTLPPFHESIRRVSGNSPGFIPPPVHISLSLPLTEDSRCWCLVHAMQGGLRLKDAVPCVFIFPNFICRVCFCNISLFAAGSGEGLNFNGLRVEVNQNLSFLIRCLAFSLCSSECCILSSWNSFVEALSSIFVISTTDHLYLRVPR
jgi:hypothetical protein